MAVTGNGQTMTYDIQWIKRIAHNTRRASTMASDTSTWMHHNQGFSVIFHFGGIAFGEARLRIFGSDVLAFFLSYE